MITIPTTGHGIYYPDSSGSTRIWEHMQTAATSTEAALVTYETFTSWTPTFFTGPTAVGSGGTREGAYMLIGKLFIGSFRIELGTTPTVSGIFELNLPVSLFGWSGIHMAVGSWYARDASPTVYYAGTIAAVSSTAVHFGGVDTGTPNASRRIDDTGPMTWTTSDILTGQLTFRTA